MYTWHGKAKLSKKKKRGLNKEGEKEEDLGQTC